MSRPAQQSSSSRLAPPSSGTPSMRQRTPTYMPEASSSRLAYAPVRGADRKGKGRAKEKDKEKVKGKWEVGTKGWVKEGFRKFGEHCARNQIRTLLIDCLVMTNLFYPSVVVWYQKRAPTSHGRDHLAGPSTRIRNGLSGHYLDHAHEGPLSVFSTPLLDSIFPDSPPLLPGLSPGGWWYADDKSAEGPRWNATSVGAGDHLLGPIEDEEIRMVTIAWIDVDSALSDNEITEDHQDDGDEARRMTERIQRSVEAWEKDHPGTRERCVRQLRPSSNSDNLAEAEGPCYLLTSDGMEGTTSFGSLSTSTNTEKDDPGVYQSVSALFHVSRTSTGFGERWKSTTGKISDESGGKVHIRPNANKEVTEEWRLSYTTTSPNPADDPTTPAKTENKYAKYFIIGYLALFIILVSQVNFATRVHSKFGLAVTGIVQLCCSAIMSLSVLALIGWNGWGWSSLPSSVPAWVLPMVIVIVGVENMSTLTKAVFSVPFHYSVPERIGLGLSRSGLKILFTSLTNILALGIIWFFVDVGSVREFCLFAITVNITDWFMLHTFYLTVLSIDAQRLELADVLATSGNQDPATQTVSTEEPDDDTHILSWRGLLAGRMFNSGTLVLTLVCVGVIYYMTDRGASSLSTPASIYKQAKQTLSALPRPNPSITSANDLVNLSTAESFWRSLNPAGWPFVRLVVPPAALIILPTPGHPLSPVNILQMAKTHRRRLPRLKPFFYLFKVVVLPQALTAGSLWALLAFLLRDAELLDAQRYRGGRGDIPRHTESKKNTGRILADQLRVDMLPCGHVSDIEVLSSSKSGRLVLSIGIDDSISLWRFHETLGTGTREVLRPVRAVQGIVAAAISADERFVSVSTEGGIVQVWQLGDGEAIAFEPIASKHRQNSHVAQMLFDVDRFVEDPFNSTAAPPSHPPIIILYSDGSLAHARPSGIETTLEACETSSTATLLKNDSNDDTTILISGDYEETLHRASENWSPTPLHSHRTAGDTMTSISPLRAIERLTRRQVYAVGRRSGIVEVFNTAGTLIGAVGQPGQLASVDQVDIAAPSFSRCTGCNVVSDDGFFVISTSGDQVYIDKVIPPNTLICRCSTSRRSIDDISRISITSHSRSSDSLSLALVVPPSASRARVSPCTSPRKSPSLLPPTSNGEFPLSSHGTRKLSAYHSHDSMSANVNVNSGNSTAVNSMGLSINGNGVNGTGSGSSDIDLGNETQAPSQAQAQPPTPDWTDMEVIPLGSISAPQGNWIVVDDTLIGLKRTSPGISHEQWQFWTIDLCQPYNGTTLNVSTAPLADLEKSTRQALFDTLYDDEGNISSEHKRSERLLSLSGRATFPPIRGSFSVPTYPSLAYIEIRSIEPKGRHAFVAAFGNQLGVITLPERQKEEIDHHQAQVQGNYNLGVAGMTPRSRLNSSSGTGGGNGEKRSNTLGLTPPPPRKFDDKKVN